MKYQYILFDLDGTLSDPQEGITKCVQYALDDQGIHVEDLNDLLCFIGPPLEESFMKYYGMNQEQARKATIKYRERFAPIGYLENKLFPETKGLLEKLKNANYQLALATSKPEIYAIKILEHFGIKDYFDVIKGAIGQRNAKGDVIYDALELLGHPDPSLCLMVGDRKHDLEGAKQNRIDSCGLYCGFAPVGELEEYGATYVMQDLNELATFLLGEKS